MTEEREKYFANISNEERVIRRIIGEYKIRRCNSKEYITNLKNQPKTLGVTLVYEEAKKDVRFYNSAIKSLKKLLPAPTRFGSCVICGCKQPKGHIRFYSYSYCAECGQKLR